MPGHDTPKKSASEFIDSLITSADTGAEAKVKTSRTYHAEFPVADILVVPEENYRWGSKEAMDADLSAKDLSTEDGVERSSFDLLVDSVRMIGVQDPSGVVMRDDGRYHVIFGFTRVCAAQRAGQRTLPVFVYDPSISDDEVEMLQMRENSPGVKRQVNWVNEVEQFESLSQRLINGSLRLREANRLREAARTDKEKDDARAAYKKALAEERVRAENIVCTVLGRHRQTMHSRAHYRRYLDERVLDIAREGRLTCSAALEFYSGDHQNLFSKEFIGEVLEAIKGAHSGEFPIKITPEAVRQAKRRVATKGHVATHGGDEDEDTEQHAITSKIRQSPGVLRDVCVCLALRMLDHERLTMASPASKVDAIADTFEWAQIVGMGMGAGDVTMPYLGANELTTAITRDKSKAFTTNREDLEDEGVKYRTERAYEESARRYATHVFVVALLRVALRDAGCPNFDADKHGWISKSTVVDDRPVHHRQAFFNAVRKGVDMPGEVGLKERAALAWKLLAAYVPRRGGKAA